MRQGGTLKQYRWKLRPAVDEAGPQSLTQSLGVSPIVAQLLCQRGFGEIDSARAFLEPRMSSLHDPAALHDCERAAKEVVQAIEASRPIVIYGDYDVDGITAASILWHMVRACGGNITTYVPHRIDEGYGLNCEALRQLASDFDHPLVISVDCGVTALEPARTARDLAMDLIITDHHHLDDAGLPDVDWLVHPGHPQGKYPFKELCGAGVAFKLAWQIAREKCGSERVSDSLRALLLDLISLAALGTIADIVPLVDENRVIARHGLGQIKRTTNVGLNALIDASRLREERVDSYHVGFVLGPRLNACGRMGHAREAVELLTLADSQRAMEIATMLTRENDRRRRVEKDIFKQAEACVIEQGFDQPDCRAIVLGGEQWHPGVIGIVASRLVDRFARPVVLLNLENGCAQGSARSVPGVSIYEALSQAHELFDSFGGHEMAAGMKLASSKVDLLRERVVSYVNEQLSPDDLSTTLEVDAEVALDDLPVRVFEEIDQLAPFGRANELPLLCVRGARLPRPAEVVGQQGRHLRLPLSQGRRVMTAIAFGMGEHREMLPAGCGVDVVFQPKLGSYRGRPQAELHVKDIRRR